MRSVQNTSQKEIIDLLGKCWMTHEGIKKLGAIDKYKCGVLYRIKCWLDALEIKNRFDPRIDKCNMYFNGNCAGEIYLF